MTMDNALFGVLLNGLMDKVHDTITDAINQAENAGLDLELEAGREISLAIENAKNSYKESLDYTLDKVSKQAKQTFDQLSSIVESFQRRNHDELGDLKKRAVQLLNQLPFSSKMPQLTTIRPQYLVVQRAANHSIKFLGNFPYSANKGFEPSFKLNNSNCSLIQSTTQELEFEVLSSQVQNDQMHRFAIQKGVLQVPWDSGWIFSHKSEFDYRVGLNILPLSPGKIVVEYAKQGEKRLEKHVKTDFISENGNDFYPEKWHTKIETIYPESGWKIDISKRPKMNVFHEHGDHKQEIATVTPQEITCKISLYCASGSDIGIFHFNVEYDAFKLQKETTTRQETLELKWGDSHIVTPNPDEEISRIIFDAYDGSHQEFASPDQSRPYLKVASEGAGKWKIWSEVPEGREG